MKNSTTKPLNELLYMTLEVYEDDYTERYLRWCMDKAKNHQTDLQKLVANRAIANYYNEKFKALEQKFIAAATPIHGTVKYSVIRKIYTDITAEIFMNYPLPLFEDARKLTIINYPNAN